MSNPSIVTYGLCKRYDRSKNFALRDLELSINPGEIYGYLGPNGAGKTTTIRLLMNFIIPTRGEARIMGLDTVDHSVEIKNQVGYLPGELALYPKMTAKQLFEYLSELRAPVRPSYTVALARRFKLPLNQRIKDLSKGNRQKVALVAAFMNEPEVLILDEPTAGLDPLMQEVFFDLIHETRERGAAIFFSSHNLAEVQRICDRVGFIREGRLVAEQAIDDLARSLGQTYVVTFDGQVPETQLKAVSGLSYKLGAGNQAIIRVKGDLKQLFRLLAKNDVRSVDRRETSLEDEFLKFYKGEG